MLSVISYKNISKWGNAIVQWTHLHFQSCGFSFKSQALITDPLELTLEVSVSLSLVSYDGNQANVVHRVRLASKF